MSSDNGAPSPGGARPYPPYVASLLERAAMLLQGHFPAVGPVPFTWWADGEECGYLARLEWPRDHGGNLRVVVLYGRTGDVVCMSKPGAPFEVDPGSVELFYVGEDEVARAMATGKAGTTGRRQ
ncbi:MAG: hypothetical protein KIT17_03825 [Rubrivivax sp.]|nr:hypothetical protein [Rubrivivax sp.]